MASETIYFLEPDGRQYLLQRTLRTDADQHRFFIDKSVSEAELRHVDPPQYRWDDTSSADANILHFDTGSFTVMVPGTFTNEELVVEKDGTTVFTSWPGNPDKQDRYGFWYAPDDFKTFSYSWMLPANIKLLSFQSNREGTWIERDRSVSFYANNVNNLVFELRYRVTPTLSGQTGSAPRSSSGVGTDDSRGCLLDCDGDGVVNRRDACPATVATVEVDQNGCPTRTQGDADGDGVNDTRDLCPESLAGASVDKAGCSLDTDGDGVPDGVDKCIATPEGSAVTEHGCATEAD